jgi:hypothetical protein
MPIQRRIDRNGPYYQWGNQKKYYYISGNMKSRHSAFSKAVMQGIAIQSQRKR